MADCFIDGCYNPEKTSPDQLYPLLYKTSAAAEIALCQLHFHGTKKDREKYIRVARDNGYTITGYFFRSVVKECIARNEKREGKQRVPTTAIPCTSNKLEMPSKEEGFDELHYVYMSDDGFIVEEWK